jgi:cell fate regulator YaaT (PSP1 superfamily)
MKKIIFYVVTDKHMDFKNLIHDVTNVLKIKIEISQINARENTRNTLSIGLCGRPLCCNKFLKNFSSISIKMAKNQGLSLSPMKISGACGKLLCCLKYEEDIYKELNDNMPPINSIVKTPNGLGRVLATNILNQTIEVVFDDDMVNNINTKVYSVDQIKLLNLS